MATITGTTFWFRIFGHRVDFLHGGSLVTVTFLALVVVVALLPVWAIGHAFMTQKSVFTSLGRSKVRWIVSMIALFLLGDLSVLLLAAFYLIRVRPQLDAGQNRNVSDRDRRALSASRHLRTK